MEETPSRQQAPDLHSGEEGGSSSDGRARQEWLARSLDREVRAPLLRAVLWAEHLLAHHTGSSTAEGSYRTGHHSIESDLVSALGRIEDILSLIRPEDRSHGDTSWIRSIVTRDLIGAALRELDPEIRRKGLRVELRVTPPDLRLVEDPDVVLHAVEALLRAGVRSAVPGSALSVDASRGPGGDHRSVGESEWLDVIVEVSAADVLSTGQEPGSGSGRPWRWTESPTGPVPLAIAAADRFTSRLGGTVDLPPPRGPDGLRVRLRIPAGQAPEHRPGWIP